MSILMMISKDRKKEIKEAADLCLHILDLYDRALPLPVHRITDKVSNCTLVPYSKYMARFNISYSDMLEFTGTLDACTDYSPSRNSYIIFYNDIDKTLLKSNRYRWNIAHELGHVFLNHLINYKQTRLFRSALSDDIYDQLEVEADCFAAYLLVPHVALYNSHIRTKLALRDLCKISTAASGSRFYDYSQWFKANREMSLWDHYDNKLQQTYSIARARKRCSSCNEVFHGNFIHYCPLCGNKLYYTLEGKMTKHKGIITNKYNRPLECPNCGNDDIPVDSTICSVCGDRVVNECMSEKCTNKYRPLPGYARYCPYCGDKTTYHIKDYILPIDDDVIARAGTVEEFDPFTPIPDEQIPF